MSGEKEGPYDWVPPSYWYDTTHYDPGDDSRTNVGGAWAFNSEASAGATVATLDSLQRFLSPFEQTQLWQSPDYVEEAQLQNYETQRAEFEAYIAHSRDAQAPSTGIVYRSAHGSTPSPAGCSPSRSRPPSRWTGRASPATCSGRRSRCSPRLRPPAQVNVTRLARACVWKIPGKLTGAGDLIPRVPRAYAPGRELRKDPRG